MHFPFFTYEPYAERLISKGYKVAIVEQVEDPKAAKGIVKRGVVLILVLKKRLKVQSL